MSAAGPSVWTGRALQAESDDLEVTGLALLYPALERNVSVPGHHGYPRALDLIPTRPQTSTGLARPRSQNRCVGIVDQCESVGEPARREKAMKKRTVDRAVDIHS